MGTIGPDESQTMPRSVALGARDSSQTLLPRSSSVEVTHVRRRLQFDHIVLALLRDRTVGGRDRHDIDRIGDPEHIQTIELARYIRHNAIVEIDRVVSCDSIERDGVIGIDPAPVSGIMRRSSVVIGDIQSVLTIPVVITRLAYIPLVSQHLESSVCSGVEHPAITCLLRLEITGILRHCPERHSHCRYRQKNYGD